MRDYPIRKNDVIVRFGELLLCIEEGPYSHGKAVVIDSPLGPLVETFAGELRTVYIHLLDPWEVIDNIEARQWDMHCSAATH